MNNKVPQNRKTMKKTYIITNTRTELVSVPGEKREMVIGNTDDFQAIAIESKLKRSNTVQPKSSTRQTKHGLRRRGSIKEAVSFEAGTSRMNKQNDAQPKKQSTTPDYTAFILPATGLPLPQMKSAPETEAEILARRDALGILTTPDTLGRLTRGLDLLSVKPEEIPVTVSPKPGKVLKPVLSESAASPSSPTNSSSSISDTTSISSTATTIAPSTTSSTPESPQPKLTPLVTVHRSDLDEIAYRNRPLTIYDDWRANRNIANTNVGRLVAENTELRNRERRYQERQRAVEDLTIELVLGESAAPGSRGRVQIEQDRQVKEMRKRDEEQWKKDLAPPTTAKEMERRNGPMMNRMRGEKLGGISEV